MTKKMTGTAAGNSEAMRIYERMEEERLRKSFRPRPKPTNRRRSPFRSSSSWMRGSALARETARLLPVRRSRECATTPRG